MKVFDLCIVGAGPVGLTLAAALQKSGSLSSIIVMDAIPQPKYAPSSAIPNQRVVSVTQSSREIWQSIGAWDKLAHSRINPYYRMHIDEHASNDDLNFDNQEAHIVEYDNIVDALLKSYEGEIRFSKPLESVELKEDDYAVVNGEFRCKLIVGSDGNKSKVKEAAKIGTFGYAYNQMGIVCTVEREDSDNKIAYQRYLKNGTPVALLPLYNPYSSIVWTAYLEDHKYLMSLSDSAFLDLLNQQFQGSPAPKIKAISNKRMAFPLQSMQAQRYIGHRVALIGDAAHSMHPMAGQGMNMGINDAALLANNVILNAKTGNDIGAEISLASFESQAKVMNYSASFAMEFIKKYYEIEQLKLIRGVGSQLVKTVQPLRDLLTKVASKHPLGPSRYEWVI